MIYESTMYGESREIVNFTLFTIFVCITYFILLNNMLNELLNCFMMKRNFSGLYTVCIFPSSEFPHISPFNGSGGWKSLRTSLGLHWMVRHVCKMLFRACLRWTDTRSRLLIVYYFSWSWFLTSEIAAAPSSWSIPSTVFIPVRNKKYTSRLQNYSRHKFGSRSVNLELIPVQDEGVFPDKNLSPILAFQVMDPRCIVTIGVRN